MHAYMHACEFRVLAVLRYVHYDMAASHRGGCAVDIGGPSVRLNVEHSCTTNWRIKGAKVSVHGIWRARGEC